MACQLAKAGWYGGDIGRIMRAPVDEVIAALRYDEFVVHYERAAYEINKGKTS